MTMYCAGKLNTRGTSNKAHPAASPTKKKAHGRVRKVTKGRKGKSRRKG